MRVFLFLPAIVSSLLILASLGNEASSRQTGSKSAGGVGPGAEVARQRNEEDGKNRQSGLPEPEQDVSLAAFGIYADEAPLPEEAEPLETNLPLKLAPGTRIAFIGNTLFERAQDFAWFEAMLQQAHPDHRLVIRNFAWSADEVDLQPRPDNFATVFQHLTRERIDLIFAAYGFNESFAGESGLETFRDKLTNYIERLRTSAFNGESGPQIILVSPIGNEDLPDIPAATLNQENLAAYTNVMREVAEANKVGFADVFSVTSSALADPDSRMTINGVHLTEAGYEIFSRQLFSEVFSESAPDVGQDLRAVLVDKNRQYFRRYRPLNTFYYTGGRRKAYGYLDFLPAMRNFEILTENREERAHAIARGETDLGMIDDSNLPPLDEVSQGRGANEWLTPADQLDAFDIDPRFEVNCFASEEDFPDIACPIQMRWDGQGRMWVACSTTYPHVYPGQEPSDKMVILEDTDGDGKADESTVWADDLHIPLSFELTKNGIFVSEEPHFSLIEDTDGDGRADKRTRLLAGFGCEDSHHALHDFVWTPDGDLLFRESIFHNSQVETPYGPVRAKNSAWFQFTPRSQRLVSFGCYPNTNPWGVTFDKWGNHVASHPIFATSFHATNPPYPEQQPKAIGIPAYSGVCGQEFVDFDFWPEEMQGGYVKVRYKPTNRVEIHRWVRQEDHFTEEYVSDLIFSRNLSFIPVDLRYGPRGAMYVCDWYNPIKGHAQYSLRDPRRDRKSGRIWRIVPKGAELANPPQIAGASPEALLELLQRPEYRYRYWAKRELRQLDPSELGEVLNPWIDALPEEAEHAQLEGLWLSRSTDSPRGDLVESLSQSESPDARAAATRQIRYLADTLPDSGLALLGEAATDPDAIVRTEAVIAASYLGSREALDAVLPVINQPMGAHLRFAAHNAFISDALEGFWRESEEYAEVAAFVESWDSYAKMSSVISKRSKKEIAFDSQENLATIEISCVPERMLYTVNQFEVTAGQPVKLVFTNPDATQHNLVIVNPGALEAVGMAGNEMAKDPNGIKKHFVPESDQILHASKLLGVDQAEVMRFEAPTEPGVYPYLCTFPGHWVIMKGEMVVKTSEASQ